MARQGTRGEWKRNSWRMFSSQRSRIRGRHRRNTAGRVFLLHARSVTRARYRSLYASFAGDGRCVRGAVDDSYLRSSRNQQWYAARTSSPIDRVAGIDRKFERGSRVCTSNPLSDIPMDLERWGIVYRLSWIRSKLSQSWSEGELEGKLRMDWLHLF